MSTIYKGVRGRICQTGNCRTASAGAKGAGDDTGTARRKSRYQKVKYFPSGEREI